MVNEINEANRPDLNISGSGSSGGGTYNKVSISGSGKITGNIECSAFKTSGSSKVEGDLKAGELIISGSSTMQKDVEAETIKVSGSSHICGNVSGNTFKISGSTKVDGSAEISELKVSGSCKIGGNIKGERFKISGSVEAGGDCECEEFNVSGTFKIGGLLNSGNVKVYLNGHSTAKEIGGETINVLKDRHLGSFIGQIIRSVFFGSISLETDIIEGDSINLEYTTAKVVRGNNVVIGEGCRVDTVEYTGNIEVSSRSKVNEQRKI